LGAKVVVAAHPTDSIVTEDAMTIAILLTFAGLGFLCWLVFNLAVFALPSFAGVAGGLFAYHTGAGPIGGAAIAMAAGATTLVAGQFVFAHSRSTILRTMIAAAFALPAAVAGYHLVLGLSAMGMPSDTWRHVFAIIGAAVVGSTAWARLVTQPSEQSAGCAAESA
jgi:MFS family permease